jgi:uncharacterized membrane protein YfcA
VEYYEIPLIILTGFIGAFLNTVGGGGSLFTVPLLTFIGLPITSANATNRVALLVQNFFAVGGFRSKKVALPWPYSLYLGLATLAGGVIGALLASRIQDELFNKIFAGVMIISVFFILFNPKRSKGEEKLTFKSQVIGSICFFFLGIYGGFVQAGIGFLILAVLSVVNNLDLVTSNYVKVFSAIVYTAASVVVFALEGKIHWATAGILAIGMAWGGWFASRWSVDKGEVWIKRVMVVSIILLAIKLWFF